MRCHDIRIHNMWSVVRAFALYSFLTYNWICAAHLNPSDKNLRTYFFGGKETRYVCNIVWTVPFFRFGNLRLIFYLKHACEILHTLCRIFAMHKDEMSKWKTTDIKNKDTATQANMAWLEWVHWIWLWSVGCEFWTRQWYSWFSSITVFTEHTHTQTYQFAAMTSSKLFSFL